MRTLARNLGCILVGALPQSVETLPPPPFLQVRYPALNAKGIAAGDLDGDGHVDVAVASLDGVHLLWGDGHGAVARRESLPVPSRGLTTADVDGDADLDLIVWDVFDLSVLLNDGSGGFSAPVVCPAVRGVRDFEVADLDGDAVLDGVAACPGEYGIAGFVVALHGDGTGGFELASKYPAPGAGDVALGELNGDGWLDLAVGSGGLLFLGDGSGGFAAAGALGGDVWAQVAIADTNSDGHQDVLLAHSGKVWVHNGDGAGGFPTSSVVPTSDTNRFLVGDANGDGDVDLIVGDFGSFTLQVLWGDGQGSFALAHVLDVGDAEFGPNRIDFADLDADGQPDIVCVNRNDVSYVIGDGAGGYARAPILSGLGGSCVELADLDGDGDRDAVTGSGQPVVALGNGDGSFASPMVSPGPGGGTMALGDLDGDGLADLVLAKFKFVYMPPPPAPTVIRLSDGLGTFPGVQTFDLRGDTANPSLADLDGDGDLDVAVGDKGGVSLLFNDGTGGFTPKRLDGPFLTVIATAADDVDLDGNVDLVVGSNDEELALIRGDGMGGFAAPEVYEVATSSAYATVACMALGDLDQDGLVDLFVGPYGDSVMVLWGQPHGLFSPAEKLPHTENLDQVRDLEIGDVDGDGLPDLVAAYEGRYAQDIAGGVALLRNHGDRRLEWTWSFGPGKPVLSAALADVDGDGRLDVVASGAYYDPVLGPGATLLRNQLPPLSACTSELVYCLAKLNSSGCLPRLCSEGSPSLSGPGGFAVRAESVLSHQAGLLFWGLGPATLPFEDGTLCVAPPLTRIPGMDSGGTPGQNDCAGAYAFAFSPAYMAAQGFAPGLQVHTQVWSRDPYLPAPFGFGLTDALRFTVLP